MLEGWEQIVRVWKNMGTSLNKSYPPEGTSIFVRLKLVLRWSSFMNTRSVPAAESVCSRSDWTCDQRWTCVTSIQPSTWVNHKVASNHIWTLNLDMFFPNKIGAFFQADFEEVEKKDAKLSKDELKELAAARKPEDQRAKYLAAKNTLKEVGVGVLVGHVGRFPLQILKFGVQGHPFQFFWGHFCSPLVLLRPWCGLRVLHSMPKVALLKPTAMAASSKDWNPKSMPAVMCVDVVLGSKDIALYIIYYIINLSLRYMICDFIILGYIQSYSRNMHLIQRQQSTHECLATWRLAAIYQLLLKIWNDKDLNNSLSPICWTVILIPIIC